MDLAALGAKTLALDVTDEDSMAAAVADIEVSEGAVGVLINNAGYSLSGAIETMPMEKVRHQFETNVFGLVRPDATRPSRDASAAFRQDRQPELDGREAHIPGRRFLSRDEACG